MLMVQRYYMGKENLLNISTGNNFKQNPQEQKKIKRYTHFMPEGFLYNQPSNKHLSKEVQKWVFLSFRETVSSYYTDSGIQKYRQ